MMFTSDFGVIHEDVLMRLFSLSLKGELQGIVFDILVEEKKSYFAWFIETFYSKWSPNHHEEWIPNDEYIKRIYEDIVDEQEASHVSIEEKAHNDVKNP